MDTPEDFLQKVKVESPLERRSLLVYLDDVIKTSFSKLNLANCKNTERQGWLRVVVNACAVAGTILKDVELNELKDEIEKIKKRLESPGSFNR